ncbi:MAG: DUF4342 domain-containing protein [Firmicutes bacterium]|jgi:hypothetical protein|nr:DUF4342 domain-containing protein [Bacillota bacterium]
MEIPLDAIEALRARVNLTYRQARDLLEETGGDLVEALIYLEENKEKFIDQAAGRGREFVHQARHLASRLHHTRVKVKVKDKTLLELPVTVTALGAAVFPKVAALGMIGLLLSRGSIEVKGDQATETEPEADKSR